jgi:hypothetical protein
MVAPNAKQQIQEVPLSIVGGNKFGRYPKINQSQTWNMIVSDDFLVPYAGYKEAAIINPSDIGRGLYASSRGNIMLAVIGNQVFTLTVTNGVLTPSASHGSLATTTGDVFIAENNNNEICITDKAYVYVWNYRTSTFSSSAPGATNVIVFPFQNPGYISFQNGRLIIASLGTQLWVLSAFNDATTWPDDSSHVGAIQTKPCFIQAAVPMPGGGNNLLVFGTNVAESWQDLGLALFPYQRNSTFNIDYGCANASSIAELEDMVVWISFNEQAGPTVMYTQGTGVHSISTDGIDFKLADLTNPSNCTGFLFRQDGHLIYQFTFPDDNLSYAYDFGTKLFFTVTDENLNYHIARQVVFFNNEYYFVSLNGGNVYQFGTQFTDADYGLGRVHQLPRIRVCPPLRLPSQRYFIIKSLGFTIENGQKNIKTVTPFPLEGADITTEDSVLITTENNILITTESDGVSTGSYTQYSEAVDLSVSRDGGESFGSSYRLEMNPTGQRRSRFIFQRLGIANDATFQLRFSGFGRFVCTTGVTEVYQ